MGSSCTPLKAARGRSAAQRPARGGLVGRGTSTLFSFFSFYFAFSKFEQKIKFE
jgi:hypothetical protein